MSGYFIEGAIAIAAIIVAYGIGYVRGDRDGYSELMQKVNEGKRAATKEGKQ